MRRAASAAVLGLLLAAAGARAQIVDGVAAIVDKDVILLSEVELAARIVLDRLTQRGPVPPEAGKQIYKEALQNLIDTKLIMTYAERVNLVAMPDEIDQAIESIAADEGVTPDDIYGAAAAQGLDREAYRRELGRQLTRMKVMSGAVRSRITVTNEEVHELFEERYGSREPGLRVRVRHILLPWPSDEAAPPKQREEMRQRMREIADQIRQSAIETGDFAAMAAQYSRAPSAADGGLTTFREGEVSPAIRDAVFGLPPGEISLVTETDHGLNIFQIVNRFDPAGVTFDEVEASLHSELIERKIKPEFEEWVEELREHRYIEIVSPELRG